MPNSIFICFYFFLFLLQGISRKWQHNNLHSVSFHRLGRFNLWVKLWEEKTSNSYKVTKEATTDSPSAMETVSSSRPCASFFLQKLCLHGDNVLRRQCDQQLLPQLQHRHAVTHDLQISKSSSAFILFLSLWPQSDQLISDWSPLRDHWSLTWSWELSSWKKGSCTHSDNYKTWRWHISWKLSLYVIYFSFLSAGIHPANICQ